MTLEEFDPPDRFVAGTVGPPGQRTFFLQASAGRRLYSVSIEKQQVSVLADRINDMLDELSEVAGAGKPILPEDNAPLDTPIEDEFRVTTLSLGWDEDRRLVVIEALDRDPEEAAIAETETGVAPEPPRVMRVVVEAASARAFARRCVALVAAGRPPCPFCGGPLEIDGHICPRANGYKR